MKPRVKDITDLLEKHFPLSLAEEWDNSGLQVGSLNQTVSRIAVAVELDHKVLTEAQQAQADLIITHHPLIFKPLKRVAVDSPAGRLISQLIKSDISLYAAHTNLDSGERGLNQLLAERLGFTDIQPLRLRSASHGEELFKIVVFVPEADLERVRTAMTQAGAGFIGRYSECTFTSRGAGTFLPQEGTHPYIGRPGFREEVDEYRLETICPGSILKAVVAEMLKAHPYEEVAYDIYRLENEGKTFSPGRRGSLKEPVTLRELAELVRSKMQLSTIRVVGDVDKRVQRVAVVSGSGASFINELAGQNIDVLITGDLKYHEARDAAAVGMAVIDATHQATEEWIITHLSQWLQAECAQAQWEVDCVPIYTDPAWSEL